MIQELQRNRKAQSFDAVPCLQASYDDLDHVLIKETFEKVGQTLTKSKLKTLKILVPYGNEDVPSNAGAILFAKPEIREQLFPSAYVSCARFAGNEKVDFIDQLDIGRVIEAVEKVPAFIRRNTRLSSVIKDIRRKDIPEYPAVAVREGLLNALMHADYAYTGMRIFVSIFPTFIAPRLHFQQLVHKADRRLGQTAG
jgi:predicted HTH transcriptional regulator